MMVYDRWRHLQGLVRRWAWAFYKAHQDTFPPNMLPKIEFTRSSLDDYEEEQSKGSQAKEIVKEFVSQAMDEIWRTPSAREKYLKEEFLQARAERAFRNVVKKYKADWKASETGEAQFNYSLFLDNLRSGLNAKRAQKKFKNIASEGEFLTSLEVRVLLLHFGTEGASAKTMPLTEIARRLGKIEKRGKKVTPTRRDVEKILTAALEKLKLVRRAFSLPGGPDLNDDIKVLKIKGF